MIIQILILIYLYEGWDLNDANLMESTQDKALLDLFDKGYVDRHENITTKGRNFVQSIEHQID